MIARVWPAALLLLATLLACLPWRLPAELQLAAPFLPVALAAHGVERGSDWLADWALAAAGLAVDVALQGPLGFWPLVYLTAYATTLLLRTPALADLLAPAAAIATIVAAGVAAWMFRSVYDWSAAGARPFVAAAGVAIALSGLVAVLATARGRLPAHADGS